MRFIPQWVFDQYPWAADAVVWLQWLKALWHEVQGAVILAGFGVLWWLLRREGLRLAERIETLRQLVTAIRDQSEEALVVAGPETPNATSSAPSNSGLSGESAEEGRQHFDVIRQLWRDARDRIELAIEDIPRSRVRMKYGRLPRHGYSDVIIALHKDGVLTKKEMVELLRMDNLFDQLKFRPTLTTLYQAENYRDSYKIGTRSLPKLPESEQPEQAELPSENLTPTPHQTQTAA